MGVDWGLMKPMEPNAYLGPLQAMAAGRQAAFETKRAQARQAALQQASTGDLEGAQQTALAGGDTDAADYVRGMSGRQAAGQLASYYTNLHPGADTVPQPGVQPSPVQALITAGTPTAPGPQPLAGGPPADPLAPLPAQPSPNGAPGAAQPAGPTVTPQLQQAATAIGHAAASGQQVDPARAWGQLLNADPKMGEVIMAHIESMDKLRMGRLAEQQDAIGSAAQTLLTSMPNATPQERAVAAQQLLPQLAAHGVTPDMVTADHLTDQGLKGIIGQSLGVKGAIDQANKSREFDQKDTAQAEIGRHNLATESQAAIDANKGEKDDYGNYRVDG